MRRVTSHSPAFTLVELLVTVVLMSVVFLLLFAGFDRVSEVVIQGGRQTSMDRSLRVALAVVRDDVEHALVREPFPLEFTRLEEGEHVAIRLVRVRPFVSSTSDLEQVEYHVGEHPYVPALRQLIRYSAPLETQIEQEDVQPLDLSEADGEIIIDELIDLRFEIWENDVQTVAGDTGVLITYPPDHVDVWIALTRPRVPNVVEPSSSWDRRVEQFLGVSERLRARPKINREPAF